MPDGALVSLYYPIPVEASPLGYARWFAERGHPVALPWFAQRGAPMEFKAWDNPFDDSLLEADPYGTLQPHGDAARVTPTVAIVPLLGFDAQGRRLGQGGGHYDRFLAANPDTVPIGIGWDCQFVDKLPREAHDVPMRAVITPTRFYGPFDAH